MRVLLVEDDGSTRRLLKAVLQQIGYECTECENAEDGWAAYQQDFHSLAVLDWMLPGMTGVELCRQIRAIPQSDGTVIVMSTSQDQLSDVEIALKAGADDYIVKPIDVTQMKIRLFIAEQRIRSLKDQKQITTALQNKLKQIETDRMRLDRKSVALIEPWKGILVAALTGNFDGKTMCDFRKKTLTEGRKHQTRQLLIDLGGADFLDNSTTQELVKMIKAAKLIGIRPILVGLSCEQADIFVETEPDLHADAYADLQSGIEAALSNMHLCISSA